MTLSDTPWQRKRNILLTIKPTLFPFACLHSFPAHSVLTMAMTCRDKHPVPRPWARQHSCCLPQRHVSQLPFPFLCTAVSTA